MKPQTDNQIRRRLEALRHCLFEDRRRANDLYVATDTDDPALRNTPRRRAGTSLRRAVEALALAEELLLDANENLNDA